MKQSGKRRPDQVAEVVRQVVAEALLTEIRDPRIGMVTVTRVEVTADLSLARVFVALGGDDEAREQALEGLTSAAGFLRARVAKSLATRITPELEFRRDRGTEHISRIDQLLSESRSDSEDV